MKKIRHFYFTLLLSLYFSLASLAVPQKKVAEIDGHPELKINLLLGDQNQALLARMAAWELQLRAQGLDVQFMLGAGELRRAVLGMSSDGPGDVEVFIHVRNEAVVPLSLRRAYQLFKEKGVDIEKELHTLFGKDKKIDAYLKDQKSLSENRPYKGDFGFFENMGDTSLNQLVYSPTDAKIYGLEQNLAALAHRQIVFLELDKAARQEKEGKVTGTKLPTYYKPLILKQALRSLRLKFDLALAENSNHLQMSESFDDVIHGFELYFGDASAETLSHYSLQPAYLAHFIKLFKNRSAQDLVRIRAWLENDYARTGQIFEGLGLDYKLLCSARPANVSSENFEFLAVHRNAAFKNLLPFLTLRPVEVENPFKSKEAFLKIAALAESTRGANRGVKIKKIPVEFLLRYSTKLALQVKNFDRLDRATQSQVIGDYVEALKDFHGPALKRLGQITFGITLFPRFDFIDLKHLKVDDRRTLLEFISDEWKIHKKQENPIASLDAEAFNQFFYDQVEARIQNALAREKVPTVVVDLDNTLYFSDSRSEYLLKKFDADVGTDYFANLHFSEMVNWPLADFIYDTLNKAGLNISQIEELHESLTDFIYEQRWTYEAFQAEVPNAALLKKLLAWKEAGIKIIFLSARSTFDRGATLAQLRRDGFSSEEVILSDHQSAPKVYKQQALLQVLASDERLEIVSVLDDNRQIVSFLQAELPQVHATQVYNRANGGEKIVEGFFTENESDFFSVHGPSDLRNCEHFLLVENRLGKSPPKIKVTKPKAAKKKA